MEIVCIVLTTIGIVISILGIVVYGKIQNQSLKDVLKLPRYFSVIRTIIRFMMIFFIAGFAIGAIDLLIIHDSHPTFYLIVIVFFVAAVFLNLFILYMYIVTKALIEKRSELDVAYSQMEKYNEKLELEVKSQVKEILDRDQLMHSVNNMASKLLSSSVKGYDETIVKCLADLGKSTDADRISIWKNYEKDNELYGKLAFEWKSKHFTCHDTVLTDVSYNEILWPWKGILLSGRNISAHTKDMSEFEREVIVPKGIHTVLIVPIFMRGRFWGFIGYDKCQIEKELNTSEEGILRAAGVMIATALQQFENMQSLVSDRQDALDTAKSKSDFLSNMSHEIRTPINAVTGMTAIAYASNDMDKIKDCLKKIDTSSRQLLALINDILDISKIGAGKMKLVNETFNLFNVVNDVRSIVAVKADEKHQSLRFRMDEDVPVFLIGDNVRLTQVLLNLLSNAIKFTDEYGRITLDVKVDSYDQENERYRISVVVKDNGIGITEEFQEHLFDAFEQAENTTSKKTGGTGLGLAISKKIAEMMNGDILVHSILGEGSIFTAVFEMQKGYKEQFVEEESTYNGTADFNGISIMLVEDIEINREIVISILGDKGIDVTSFENGKDASDAYAQEPEKYNLILMDIHMPTMDGYVATKHIRSMEEDLGTRVPIIAMTANAFEEDIKKCKDAGMDDHIAKPIDYDKLFCLVDKYVNH